MKQFNVFCENRVGELARVTEALAQSAINIRGLATDYGASKPSIRVITDDEASTRNALKRNGFSFDEADVVSVDLSDRPGEIAKMARRIASANLNIDSVFLLGKKNTAASLALVTNDPKKAREFLED
jgi:hypothetical protein